MDSRTREERKKAITLLAFITLVKNAHSNSVLFKEAAYVMAQKVGLSDGRIFNKYLNQCLEKGLCTPQEQRYNTNGRRTVYKFIAYKEALTILLGIKSGELKHFILHRGKKKFKDYQYQIENDIIGLNFLQQEYKANSNFPNKTKIMQEITNLYKIPVSERTPRATKSKRTKLFRKMNEADRRNEHSTYKGHTNGIVTGCNHIGKLIGKSGTTGYKRLKRMIDANQMQVHDIVYYTPTSSQLEAFHCIDSLRESKARGIHVYSKKEGGVKTIMGKKVIGFTSASYNYTAPSNDNSSLTFSKSSKTNQTKI